MIGKVNQNIKNFRKFRGKSQEELAIRIGKTKNVISNWERGDNNPDVDSLEKICKELDITPNQLYGWEPLEAYEKYNEMMLVKREQLNKLEKEKHKLQAQIDFLSREIREDEARLKDGD